MLQKLIDALDSNQSPDVLLLGSSLVLNPSVRCDDQFAGRRTRYDGWYFAHVIQPYSKSDYFAALLASAARKKLITENLAIPGALVSDQRLILEKLLKNGKKPQIVFFFVEPRAFLDNTMPPEEKTPTAEVLSSYLNLKMLLNDPAAISHLPETVLGLVSNYYQERSDYRFFIVNLSSHMSGHPVGLFEAGVEGARKPTAVLPCLVAANKPSYEESANELRDLDVYKCRYLPVNWKRLQIQEKEFNELAHLTRDNHVQLVVVKMPITKENLSLLPQEAVTKYNTAIQKMSAAGVEVIDPSDKLKFDLSDYEDSVHLNGRGGAKLFRYIAETAALSLKQ